MILVTHQVTIAAITGLGVLSGEAVVLEAGGGGEFQVVGTIEAG